MHNDSAVELGGLSVLASEPPSRTLSESSLELLARGSTRLILDAGDLLFAEGNDADAMYVVQSGNLEMLAGNGQHCQPIASFGAGDCIGETVVLFNRPRPATVYASTRSELLKLPLPLLANLSELHPDVYAELRRIASWRLSSFHLSSSPLMAGVDADDLRLLGGEQNWLRLARGQLLFRQGDAPDYLYVVVCGRLEVSIHRDGKDEVVAHVGRGGCVGETDSLTGEPRSATVRATRDTQLVQLSKEQLESLVRRNPQCVRELAKTVTAGARQNGTSATRRRVRTIALVPLQSRGLPAGFVERFLDELSPIAGPAFGLSSRRIDGDLGPGASAARDDVSHTRLINWMAEYEDKFPCLLLECDPHPSIWTDLCIRHADLILIVAASSADPSLRPIEAALFDRQTPASSPRRQLVLVHPDETVLPSGTSRWLACRDVEAHHHIRSGRKSDYQRLARFIADKDAGVVLSGGGARGFAHVGALQALTDCGVPIDSIGGTSIGAAVAAHVAMGVDMAALTQIGIEFGKNFSRRFLRDLTFPTVSLNSAHRFSLYLQESFGDVSVEDLWIPYFCTSSNLSTAQVAVHDKGALWTWVRASCSVPGVWPPVVHDGNMLVDGGVMNNLPVDVMRGRCRGPVVAIDVCPTMKMPVQSEPLAELSGWPMLWKRLNPFGEKADLPHIFSILLRTSQLSSMCSIDAGRQNADLYLHPPTAEVDLFDFKSAPKLIDLAYKHCRESVAQWKR